MNLAAFLVIICSCNKLSCFLSFRELHLISIFIDQLICEVLRPAGTDNGCGRHAGDTVSYGNIGVANLARDAADDIIESSFDLFLFTTVKILRPRQILHIFSIAKNANIIKSLCFNNLASNFICRLKIPSMWIS